MSELWPMGLLLLNTKSHVHKCIWLSLLGFLTKSDLTPLLELQEAKAGRGEGISHMQKKKKKKKKKNVGVVWGGGGGGGGDKASTPCIGDCLGETV